MRSIVPIITAFAVLVSFDPLAITAQQPPGSAPSRGPGWLPRGSRLYTADYKVAPAELTAVINRLKEVERMFLQANELARPVGFEIEPTFHGFSPNESVLSYSYDAMFYVPSKKIAGEGTSCLSVSFNQIPGRGLNGMEGYRDDRGAFFFEDPRGDPIPGATHVWNRLSPTERSWVDVMFTSGNVSPVEGTFPTGEGQVLRGVPIRSCHRDPVQEVDGPRRRSGKRIGRDLPQRYLQLKLPRSGRRWKTPSGERRRA